MLEAPVNITDLTLPRHVAIIMDGNGRWAKERHLPRAAGHREGAEAVRRTVTASHELGIEYLTVYAFSSENWKRPTSEVEDLMGLLRSYLNREIDELHSNNVRLRVIGEREGLAKDIRDLINEGEQKTKNNTSMVLTIALNYGGHAEIVKAVREIAEQVAAGKLTAEDITEELFADYLYTRDLPDPDLLIRTSGEQRLSNFLPWQSAYTELMFVEENWPEFNKETLTSAIQSYALRDRRFGASSD